MKGKYVEPLMLLASTLLISVTYSQTWPLSPVRGELVFSVENQPAQYNVLVSFNRSGMLFMG